MGPRVWGGPGQALLPWSPSHPRGLSTRKRRVKGQQRGDRPKSGTYLGSVPKKTLGSGRGFIPTLGRPGGCPGSRRAPGGGEVLCWIWPLGAAEGRADLGRFGGIFAMGAGGSRVLGCGHRGFSWHWGLLAVPSAGVGSITGPHPHPPQPPHPAFGGTAGMQSAGSIPPIPGGFPGHHQPTEEGQTQPIPHQTLPPNCEITMIIVIIKNQ